MILKVCNINAHDDTFEYIAAAKTTARKYSPRTLR